MCVDRCAGEHASTHDGIHTHTATIPFAQALVGTVHAMVRPPKGLSLLLLLANFAVLGLLGLCGLFARPCLCYLCCVCVWGYVAVPYSRVSEQLHEMDD